MVDEFDVYRYLCKTLPNENDWCFYEAGSGKVAENSVKPGDFIIFSFQHNILAIDQLESGRLPSGVVGLKYRYEFKPGSIYIFPLGIRLNDLHDYLKTQGLDVGAKYTERQDWPIIDNSFAALVVAWLKCKVFDYYNSFGIRK